MYRFTTILTAAALALLLAAAAASGATWPYPNEVSVTSVYNSLWNTGYDNTPDGLAALRADHGATVDDAFNTGSFSSLTVWAYDTSSSRTLSLGYGEDFSQKIDLWSPDAWTAPTRGEKPAGDAIDLAALIGPDADFRLFMGEMLISELNSIKVLGENEQFLLGLNEGGDKDYNEPLLQGGTAAVPLPGAALLLAGGFLPLAPAAFRRLRA